MPNLNSCNFIGHAGRDAEVHVTKNDKTIVNITVAVNVGWGEHKETAWVRLRIIGKPTDWMQHTRKGDIVQAHNVEYHIDEVEREDKTDRYHYFLAGVGSMVSTCPKGSYSEGAKAQAQTDRVSDFTQDAQDNDNQNNNNGDEDDLPF